MNVSLLSKYNNYSYPARGMARLNRAGRTQASAVSENTQNIINDSTNTHKKHLENHHYPSKLAKRVGYTELNCSWDQFTVTRFVELIEKNTGNTLDAGAVMRRYDADGDGLLNMEEQTAMIEGLTSNDYEGDAISRSVAESIVEQLREMNVQNESRFVSGIQKAARRYERLFLYDGSEIPEDAAMIAV